MGTGPLAHPFRLAANGTVLTRVAGSEEDVNDRLRLIVETIQDERPMFPSYGVPDPAFVGLSAGDIQACLSEFGPEGVTIDDFELDPIDARTASVHIHWEMEDSEDETDEDEDEDVLSEDDFEDDEE